MDFKLFGKATLVSDEQSMNALSPMAVSVFGRLTLVILL